MGDIKMRGEIQVLQVEVQTLKAKMAEQQQVISNLTVLVEQLVAMRAAKSVPPEKAHGTGLRHGSNRARQAKQDKQAAKASV